MRQIVTCGFIGPYINDFRSLGGILVQVKSGALRGLRREKEGWDEVQVELVESLPAHAATLRLTPDVGSQIVTLSHQLQQVRELNRWAEDLAASTRATKVLLEDRREALVKTVVDAVRTYSTREDMTVVVAFQKTVRYYGQLGVQSAKARAKNKAGAEAVLEAMTEAEVAPDEVEGPESQAA